MQRPATAPGGESLAAPPPGPPRPNLTPPPPKPAGPTVESRAGQIGTEGHTEQFPRVDVDQPGVEAAQGYRGTGSLGEYGEADETQLAPVGDYGDPYDFDNFGDDDFEDENYEESGYQEDHDLVEGGFTGEQYDPEEMPAGMEADDFFAEEDPGEKTERSPGKEWVVLALQVGVGLLGGGIVWFGFRWLWIAMPLAALVAALVVTGGLVLIARKILRTDDLQTILLAVLVGLTCTVSPAALLLVGH